MRIATTDDDPLVKVSQRRMHVARGGGRGKGEGAVLHNIVNKRNSHGYIPTFATLHGI